MGILTNLFTDMQEMGCGNYCAHEIWDSLHPNNFQQAKDINNPRIGMAKDSTILCLKAHSKSLPG